MPTIIAVSEKERLPLYFGDPKNPDHSRIDYRRLPAKVRREIVDKHTVIGVTNWYSAGMDMVQYAVVGWHNIPDAEGRDLPFHEGLTQWLPDDAISAVLNKLNENAPAAFFERWNGHGSAPDPSAPSAARPAEANTGSDASNHLATNMLASTASQA